MAASEFSVSLSSRIFNSFSDKLTVSSTPGPPSTFLASSPLSQTQQNERKENIKEHFRKTTPSSPGPISTTDDKISPSRKKKPSVSPISQSSAVTEAVSACVEMLVPSSILPGFQTSRIATSCAFLTGDSSSWRFLTRREWKAKKKFEGANSTLEGESDSLEESPKHYFSPEPLISHIVSLSSTQSLLPNLNPCVVAQLARSVEDSLSNLACCGAFPDAPCRRQQPLRRGGGLKSLSSVEVNLPSVLTSRECTLRLYFADFCSRLLCPDPTQRMTAGEALNHPFLNLPEATHAFEDTGPGLEIEPNVTVQFNKSSKNPELNSLLEEEDYHIKSRRLAVLSSALSNSIRGHNSHLGHMHHSHHQQQPPQELRHLQLQQQFYHRQQHVYHRVNVYSSSTQSSPILSPLNSPAVDPSLASFSLSTVVQRLKGGVSEAGPPSPPDQPLGSPKSSQWPSLSSIRLPTPLNNPLNIVSPTSRMRSQTVADPLAFSILGMGGAPRTPFPQVFSPEWELPKAEVFGGSEDYKQFGFSGARSLCSGYPDCIRPPFPSHQNVSPSGPPPLFSQGITPSFLSHPLLPPSPNSAATTPQLLPQYPSSQSQIPYLSIDTNGMSSFHSSQVTLNTSSQPSSPVHGPLPHRWGTSGGAGGGAVAPGPGGFPDNAIPFSLPLPAFSHSHTSMTQGSSSNAFPNSSFTPSIQSLYSTQSPSSSPPQSPRSSSTLSSFGPRSRGSSLAGGGISLYTSSSGHSGGSFSPGSTSSSGTPPLGPLLQSPPVPRLWPPSQTK